MSLKHIPRTAYFELTLWKELYFEYSPYYNSIVVEDKDNENTYSNMFSD
jgi:hypothetical protein